MTPPPSAPRAPELAIVGLGPWGLSVLERIVSWTRRSPVRVHVHVVQPGAVGGVYDVRQPDFLLLNNPCGQLSLYASPDEADGDVERLYGRGLYAWARDSGYRWVGWECRIDPEGVPLRPTDFLPRRLMGEYLTAFYRALVLDAPANLTITHHDSVAVDIVADGDRERVDLVDGASITVDHVVLTSGHTWNDEPQTGPGAVRLARPYPVEHFDRTIAPCAKVAIAGMGLAAFDLMIALTVGRGGTFVGEGFERRYVPSGREPRIYLYSRSGVPYCAKSAHGIDPTGDYEPLVGTAEAFKAIATRQSSPGGAPGIDFRTEILPIILAEMQCRYRHHAALLLGGREAAREVDRRLSEAWRSGTFAQVVDEMEASHGRFDPAEHLFADMTDERSSDAYEAKVRRMLCVDLREAHTEGGSAVKAAQEVTRILRDDLRSVLEFGGLSHESYLDFQANVRTRINRLEAGPPALRCEQLLALMDAGVVQIPFGPNPRVTAEADGRALIRSTNFDRELAVTVETVLRGHLDLPSLSQSASPLIRRLYATGRLAPLSYGGVAVGSVALDEEFHPIHADGSTQDRMFVLGVLTEGARYFTHYLPSPRSRLRAVLDAQACVAVALSSR